MLHMMRMAAGIRDFEQLRMRVATGTGRSERVSIQTRNFPKRADEIINGGSMYFVTGRTMVARMRVADIMEASYQDGSKCALITLENPLVAVAHRPMKPFQGWRYLEANQAPPDIIEGAAATIDEEMPEAMRRELKALGLL